MDDIQTRNESESTSVIRDGHPHTFVEHKFHRREAVDCGVEIISSRMAGAENINLVAVFLQLTSHHFQDGDNTVYLWSIGISKYSDFHLMPQ